MALASRATALVGLICLAGLGRAFSAELGSCRGTFVLGEHPVSMTMESLRKAAAASGAGPLVRVAALVDAEFSASSLLGTGCRLVSQVNDFVTIEGHERSVPFLRAVPGIRLVEYRKNIHPTMDSVRRETHINELQGGAGTSLTRSFTGNGVLFGILDNEFDTHEPAFLDSLGHTRFIALWNQADKSNSQKNRFGYGLIKQGIDVDKDTLFGSDSNEYHGTHMASCGAGADKNYLQYAGAARNAKIVAVKYGNTTADFMNGLAWVFSIADSLKKPCVVNMSIGSASGPHDGTSLMDQRIDSIAGKGHIIVGAAGNDGSLKEHVAFSIVAQGWKGTWVEPTPPEGAAGQGGVWSYFDIWGEANKAFNDTIYILDKRDLSYQKSGNALVTSQLASQYFLDTLRWPNVVTGPDTLILEAIVERANAANRKPHIDIALYSSNPNLMMGAKLASTVATTVHGWNAGKMNCYGEGIAGFVDGDSSMTINEVGGTAKSIIAVGGYNSKVSPLRYDGTVFGAGDTTLYDYLSYTSLGPTADGRIKPDISAPGREVTGAMTRYIVDNGGRTAVWPNPQSKIGRYAFLGGTSISSPIVAGIVACMLEYNPALTPQVVDSILGISAIKDKFTGQITTRDVRWGAGKVNAERAMAALGVPANATQILIQATPVRVAARFTERNRLIVSWTMTRKVQVVTLSLFDMGGRQLWAGIVNNGRPATVPVQLKSGCYFLRLRFGSGAVIVHPIVQLP